MDPCDEREIFADDFFGKTNSVSGLGNDSRSERLNLMVDNFLKYLAFFPHDFRCRILGWICGERKCLLMIFRQTNSMPDWEKDPLAENAYNLLGVHIY